MVSNPAARLAANPRGRHWGPRPLDIDIISTRLAIGRTGQINAITIVAVRIIVQNVVVKNQVVIDAGGVGDFILDAVGAIVVNDAVSDRGVLIADVPSIVGSLDIVMGEIDR